MFKQLICVRFGWTVLGCILHLHDNMAERPLGSQNITLEQPQCMGQATDGAHLTHMLKLRLASLHYLLTVRLMPWLHSITPTHEGPCVHTFFWGHPANRTPFQTIWPMLKSSLKSSIEQFDNLEQSHLRIITRIRQITWKQQGHKARRSQLSDSLTRRLVTHQAGRMCWMSWEKSCTTLQLHQQGWKDGS